MIDFGLSEEQEALQRSAREFLARECPPALVRDTAKSDDGVPRDLYRKMAELGWMGLIVPEKEGGLGLGALDLALVMEELGRVAAPGPFLATQLVIAGLLRAGTAAQRAAWLPRLMDGSAFATLAHLEESDRHDPEGIQARAKKDTRRLGALGNEALRARGRVRGRVPRRRAHEGRPWRRRRVAVPRRA